MIQKDKMDKLKQLNNRLYTGITGQTKGDIVENFDKFLNTYEKFIDYYEQYNFFKNSLSKLTFKQIMNLNLSKNKPKNQTEAVLQWLLSGRTITQLEAIEYFSAFRLSAIIFILRNSPYNYDIVDIGNSHFSVYVLKEFENNHR